MTGTRRRGAVLEAALLDAAWAELQASGYQGLTMEAVAERAGTSRAVLYRRWPSRAELVIAAMRRHRPMLSGEVPDTGSLRGDVLALLRRVSARLAELDPDTLLGLLGDCFGDAGQLSRLQEQVLHIGADVMGLIVKRAADRGEISADLSPRVAQLPVVLYRYEVIFSRRPVSDRGITEIVDEVFLPLAMGPGTHAMGPGAGPAD